MGYSLPFFPMYAAETLADGRFQSWTVAERGSWLTLILLNWNDGDIPAAKQDLARLLRLESGEMAQVWSAIGSRFVEVPGKPGRLWSPRLEEERDRAEQLSNKRSDAGTRGATARWNGEKHQHGKRMRLPEQTHGKANAIACHVPSPPPSPPHPKEAQEARVPNALRARWEQAHPIAAELLRVIAAGNLTLNPPRQEPVTAGIERDAKELGIEASALVVIQEHQRDPNPSLGWYGKALHRAAALAATRESAPAGPLPAPDPAWLDAHPGSREAWPQWEANARSKAPDLGPGLAKALGTALFLFQAEFGEAS